MGTSRGLRWAGAVLVVAALAALVWVHRGELPTTGRALRDADRGWLVVGVAALVLLWVDWVLLHVFCRRLVGVGGFAEIIFLVPVTVAALALNLAVKSGGLAGLAVFVADGRRRGLSAARVSGAYVVAAAMTEVAFVVTLAAGIVVVWLDGRITRPEVVAVVIFVVMLTVHVAALLAAVRSRELLRRLWSLPDRAVDVVLRRPTRQHDVTGADELYEAVGLLRRRPVAMLPAVGCAVAIDLLGVVMLWAALAAVGGGDRPVVALVAYAISTLFGIVGVSPGGLGFVEVGAVAVLAAFGTSVGVAAAAVVVFRVLQFWLPVVVGALVSWWLRRRGADRARRVAQAPA
ncbi:MAG: lysylphosphatidylglycerol synthase transmembrane domain-containing protein [Pseudonocardiaceae bacterium]